MILVLSCRQSYYYLPVKNMELVMNIAIIESIAQKTLGIETLKSRNSDSLDFYDLGVGCIKDALELAYKTGMDAGLSYYAVNQEGKAHD